MAAKSWIKKHDEIRREATKAWKWLTKLPAYRKAYAEFYVALKETKKEQPRTLLDPTPLEKLRPRFEKTWGFYPLPEPKFNGYIPTIDFFASIGKLFGQHPYYLNGVRMKNLDTTQLSALVYDKKRKAWMSKYNPNLPALPNRIIFEVDPHKPLHHILEQIKSDMEEIRKAYGIKDKRPRQGSLYLMYKTRVLRQLGLSQAKITKKLFPKMGETSPDQQKSYEKRASRLWNHVTKKS